MRRLFAAGWLPAAVVATLSSGAASALDPARALNQYSLDHWSTRDGLPQNTIQALLQSRDGYLWMGTQEGLVRFDGVRFTVFDHANTAALLNNHVSVLVESRDGSLWAGTFGGGLARLRDGIFEVYDQTHGLSGSSVTAVAEDAAGRLWVGTSTEGLNLLEAGQFRVLTTADGLPGNQIRALLVEAGGVWVGTSVGLARLGPDGRAVPGVDRALAGASVTTLLRDRQGALWVGTTHGLHRLQDGRLTRYGIAQGLPHDYIESLYADSRGVLWVGTSGGVARMLEGRFEVLRTSEGLSNNAVRSFVEDREGSLWVGTGGGLTRLRDGRATTFSFGHGLSDDDLYTVAPDRSGAGVWIGSYDGRVDHLSGGRFVSLHSAGPLAASRVRALHEDRAGRLWIGTERGLHRYAGGVYTTFGAAHGLPQTAVRAVLEDRRGALWVGLDDGGLYRLQDGRVTAFSQKDGLGSPEVRALLEDRRGVLWVATYGGLARFQDGRFVTYGRERGLSVEFARSLHEDADGTLWVGTYGGGLNRFRDGRFTAFTTRQGLLSDVIYQILEDDDGNLWMSCNKGVFRVSKLDLQAVAEGRLHGVRAIAYDEGDGMRSRECNGGGPAGARTRDGRLWFPTLQGLAMFDPARNSSNTTPPPVVIEDLVVDGRMLDARRGLRVEPRPQRLEFRFTALSFVAPAKVRFAYQLVGFDGDWVDGGGARAAQYTHVPPGRYTFRVKACNNDGVWNEAGQSLAVVVEPAFHETWWFAGLSVFSVVGLGLGLYNLRIRRIRGRERALEVRIREALAKIKVLSGLLPICASCKKIRDDKGYWSQIEVYLREHSQADFSHGICPDCFSTLYPELAAPEGEKPT